MRSLCLNWITTGSQMTASFLPDQERCSPSSYRNATRLTQATCPQRDLLLLPRRCEAYPPPISKLQSRRGRLTQTRIVVPDSTCRSVVLFPYIASTDTVSAETVLEDPREHFWCSQARVEATTQVVAVRISLCCLQLVSCHSSSSAYQQPHGSSRHNAYCLLKWMPSRWKDAVLAGCHSRSMVDMPSTMCPMQFQCALG